VIQLILMLTAALWFFHFQSPELNSTEPYRVTAGNVSTLQKNLDDAASAGYRVAMGSRAGLGGVGVLLEKSPGTEPYRYKVLSTVRTSTMQKEIDQYTVEGYRIVSRALVGGNGKEIVVILEKSANGSSPKYRLFATTRTGTMRKEIVQSAQDGFSICCVVSRNEHVVIMEKTAEPAAKTPQATDAYALLATEKTSTMQKELKEKAAVGYRVLAGTPTSETEIVMFMEKTTNPTGLFSYKLLATNKAATLQSELNVAAFEGYRLIAGSVAGKRATKGGGLGRLVRDSVTPVHFPETPLGPDEIVAVMEKEAVVKSRYEYLVLSHGGIASIQSEILRAVQDGYRPVAMTGNPSVESGIPLVPVTATLVVIMERTTP